MVDLFISVFVTLFIIIDPPGAAAIYASLTSGSTAAHRRSMAIRACVVAFVVLLLFALFGRQVTSALGISLDSFRIAGGILLFLFALDITFEKRSNRREQRAQKIRDDGEAEDVSIFPMAMPMIAGPGSIAAIMLQVADNPAWQAQVVILAALVLVLVLTLAALLATEPLMKLIGPRVEAVITRLLGILLAALATQYVVDGVRALFVS